ncbi:unnamed protein product [Ixodes hexagonus]
MAKRRADKEMNHDNWDNEEEDEEEEPGQFKQADTDELKRRVIKLGRRSVSNSPAASSPFANFGFGSAASKPASSTFSLPNGSSAAKPGSSAKEAPSLSNPEFLGKLKVTTLASARLVRLVRRHFDGQPPGSQRPPARKYRREIGAGNTMPMHVHFSLVLVGSVEQQDGTAGLLTWLAGSALTENELPGNFSLSAFNSESSSTSLSFPAATKPTFQFALAATAPSASQDNSRDPDDENYVPPKNEFVAVEEKDAVYSKRQVWCKLFHKKDDGYVERGVGMLYVKPLKERHQLLLRADTSLGNILLNIMLVPSLPVSRLGKNNVALVCVPNPPMDPNDSSPAPTTLLLRVRTAEDADQLRDTLNRYKGQS